MLRPAILLAALVVVAVSASVTGCGGPDTSRCPSFCTKQSDACPMSAPSSDECLNQCEQEIDGLDGVSDICVQAYQDWLSCIETEGTFVCSANAAPSGCDSEQSAWASCGTR